MISTFVCIYRDILPYIAIFFEYRYRYRYRDVFYSIYRISISRWNLNTAQLYCIYTIILATSAHIYTCVFCRRLRRSDDYFVQSRSILASGNHCKCNWEFECGVYHLFWFSTFIYFVLEFTCNHCYFVLAVKPSSYVVDLFIIDKLRNYWMRFGTPPYDATRNTISRANSSAPAPCPYHMGVVFYRDILAGTTMKKLSQFICPTLYEALGRSYGKLHMQRSDL